MAQLPILKKNVDRSICKIIQKTVSTTANALLEDIDLRVEGEGSEVYNYKIYTALHSVSAGDAILYLNTNNNGSNSETYDRHIMQGYATTTSASDGTTTGVNLCRTGSNAYPSFCDMMLKDKAGNYPSLDYFTFFENSSGRHIAKYGSFLRNSLDEINSIQFYCNDTSTITYSIIIIAVPKFQYNPNAILFDAVEWNEDGINYPISGFSGDEYDVMVDCDMQNDDGDRLILIINGIDNTTNRIEQVARNNNGTLSAARSTTEVFDSEIRSGTCFLRKETGSNSIAITTDSNTSAYQQLDQYTVNENITPDEFTELYLLPAGIPSGKAYIYLIPKDLNGDLTPWRFRQSVKLNAEDFSTGADFEIPEWATLMKVVWDGDTTEGQFLVDFNNLGVSINTQILNMTGTTEQAQFVTSNNSLALVGASSHFEATMFLSEGYNRTFLTRSNASTDYIRYQGSTVLNSLDKFTSVQISKDDTDAVTGTLTVSFY